MRIEKVNEVVKREIGNMLMFGDISDPRVAFVTIMSVEVSKDLQHARIKYSVLKDDAKMIKDAQDGLDSCRGFIRKLLGQRITLRYIPELRFYFDKGFQHAAHIDATLAEIKRTMPPAEENE